MQHYVIQLYNIMQHYNPRRYVAAYSPPYRREQVFAAITVHNLIGISFIIVCNMRR